MRPLLLATLALISTASFFPGARLWGINHLAFYPLPIRLLFLAAIAAGLVPGVADALVRGARRFFDWQTPRHRSVATAISLAFFALFMILPSATLLMGDGYFIAKSGREMATADASTFSSGLRHLHPVFPGTELLYALTSRLAARVFQADAATVIRLLVAMIGQQVMFGLAVWALRPQPPAHPMDRLTALLLAASGGVVLFFGYVEVYAPFLGVLVLYVIASHRVLGGAGAFWKPLVLVIAASALHLMGLVLLPSLVWLGLSRGKGRAAARRFKRAATWAFIAMAPLPWLARLVPGVDRYIRPLAGESGTLGPVHLADMANLSWLISPAIVVLGGVAIWNRLAARRRTHVPPISADLEGVFLALIAVPMLLFLLAFRSDLGVARDWDLFVPGGLAWLALACREFRQGPARTISDRNAASLFVLCATMTCAWIGINASDARSVARYRAILTNDQARVADLGYAYEQLATYYSDRKDIRGEIDALEHAVHVSDNPRYRLTLGMRYYHLDDRDRGIELVERALRSTPNDGRTRQILVQMLYFAGRMDELERVCDEGIRIEPRQPLYYFLKGRALARAGRTQEALDALRRARSLSPPPRMAHDIDAEIRALEGGP